MENRRLCRSSTGSFKTAPSLSLTISTTSTCQDFARTSGRSSGSSLNRRNSDRGINKCVAMTHKPLMRQMKTEPPVMAVSLDGGSVIKDRRADASQAGSPCSPNVNRNRADLKVPHSKPQPVSIGGVELWTSGQDRSPVVSSKDDRDSITQISRLNTSVSQVLFGQGKEQDLTKPLRVAISSHSNAGSMETLDDSHGSLEKKDRSVTSLSSAGTILTTECNNSAESEQRSYPQKMVKSARDALTAPWLPIIPAMVLISCIIIFNSFILFFGMMCGGAAMFTFLRSYSWIISPEVIKVFLPPEDSPIDESLEFSFKYQQKNPNESREERIYEYQGWLNLLEGEPYRPETYHINNTVTVSVRLKGTRLRVQKPREDIPKRSMWNEPSHSITLIKQTTVDVRNYSVILLPRELVRKRIWSKKYPLCLLHHDNGKPMRTDGTEKSFFSESKNAPQTIVFFARTGREKEEWFRRLEQASRGLPLTTLIEEVRHWVQIKKQNKQDLLTEHTGAGRVLSKGRKRVVSDIALVDDTKIGGKKKPNSKALFDRDHKELLTSYMECMMEVTEKCAKFDPTIAQAADLSWDSVSMRSSASLSSPAPMGGSGLNSGLASGSNKGHALRANHTPSRKSSSHGASPVREALSLTCDTGVLWVNAFLQRIFFDFFREEFWQLKMQEKIQRKLEKISLPHYVNPLILSNIKLGDSFPIIKKIDKPYLSDDGLWFEALIAYRGGLKMTIETKINLKGLRKSEEQETVTSKDKIMSKAITDEEADDSEDSSTSSEGSKDPLLDPKQSPDKITRFFESLKDSKYFQKLANTKLVKTALDKVSNTRLKLCVELNYLTGIIGINVPVPPTDRLWMGFRGNPELVLNAKPVVGEKSLNVAKLSEWIENKLITEFQRLLIIPNMMDMFVPFMCPNYAPAAGRGHKKSKKLSKMKQTKSDSESNIGVFRDTHQ